MKPSLKLRSFLFACGSLLAFTNAHATDLYWDSNGATVGFGTANGTWGTSTFWSSDSTGESATANTTTTTADTVYFGTDTLGYTGGRTVTISGTRDVNNIIFGSASGAVTISGGTALSLGGTTPTLTVNNATTTISSVITGSDGLKKDGDGLLILTGLNTYTGKTLVSGGTLRFGSTYNNSWVNGRLPSTSNLEINGGIVQAYYYMTRTLGTGDGEIQITGGRSGFTNMQGDATANFLTFTNTATTVTWGDAAFNPSTLVLNDTGASAVMRLANPFDLNGAARTIEVSATGTGGGRGTYGILTGNLSGTGASLLKTGAGTLMLDGTNSYDGGTTINGGGVWFRDKAAMSASGTVAVNDGAILSVGVGGGGEWTTGTSGVGTLGGLLAGDGGQTAAQVTYAGNVAVGFNVSGTQTYSGDIADVTGSTTTAIHIGNKDSGTASDPFTAAGTLTLNGDNSYTGGTSINRGTLIAGSATALGTSGDISFNGGTLQYTASSAAVDYGSRIKNSTAAISLNTNGQDVTLSELGNTNTGGLSKSGSGTLTLTGNGYSGVTTISGGAITLNDGTVSGGGVTFGASNTSISVLGGTGVSSTWDLGGQQLGTGNSNYSNLQMVIDGDGVAGSALVTNVGILNWGRTVTSNSTILLTDGGQMNVNSEVRIGNPYYSENGGANLTIGGGTATSTFSGDGGDDFYIGYGERTGSKDNVVTVNTGGVLTNVRDMYVGNVNNTQNNLNPSTNNQLLVTGGTASMRGLSLGNATVARSAIANVVEVTSGGQLSTTGTSYIGRANVAGSTSNDNTLTISGTGSSWDAGNQDVYVGHTNNATAQSNGNILTVGTDGELTNVKNLTVGFGSGTETGNQLVVNGSLSVNTLTVSTDNTLSGSGTIRGAITINGILSPGTSPGQLNVMDSLGLGASSTTLMEIGGTTLGAAYDNISFAAAATLVYGGSLNVVNFGGYDIDSASATYDLFSFIEVPTGEFASVTVNGVSLTNALGTWSGDNGGVNYSFSQDFGDLSVAAIPEPSSAALIGVLGAMALLRRRR